MKVIKSYKNLASPLTLPYLVINSHDVTEHVDLVREHLQATYKPVGKFYKSGQPQRHVLVVLPQARVSEEVLKGEDRAVITSSWAKGRLVALRFWVGALQIHKARICLIRLHDARHIAPPLRPVQDILGHSANHNNTNSAPSMKSAERSSTHDHMLKNRPREDRGVSSSIARTVNHSASPLGMTIPIGLSSSRGQRAFFGTGSGAERPAIILSLTMSRGRRSLRSIASGGPRGWERSLRRCALTLLSYRPPTPSPALNPYTALSPRKPGEPLKGL